MGLCEQALYISDFGANYTYGTKGCNTHVQKKFLECMYKIFGKEYIEAYKAHVKKEHNQKVAKFMDAEYNNYTEKLEQINEIIK